MKKRIGILFVIMILLTACAPSTETIVKQTAVRATSTSMSIPALEIGSTFSSGSYDVKLLQVVEWPKITVLNSQSFNTIPPKQSDHNWLMLTVEVKNNEAAASLNLGELASSLALSRGDSVMVDSDGEKYELTAIGSPTPPEKGFFVTKILEQNLSQMVAIFVPPLGGSIFITPDGIQKLVVAPPPLKDGQIDLGNTSVLADPAGPKWFVGLEKAGGGTGNVAQFSLLFEIPKGATGLQWQFLSALTKLPLPTVGTIPEESGGEGLKVTIYTPPFSETCKAWEALLPCGMPSTPRPPTATLMSTPMPPTATSTNTPIPPTPTVEAILGSNEPVVIGDFELSISSVDLSDQGFNGWVPANLTTDETVLTVEGILNSGNLADLSKIGVWVTDESGDRTSSGITLSVESEKEVIWLFPVPKTAHSFYLHFPSGEVIDLSPLLSSETPIVSPSLENPVATIQTSTLQPLAAGPFQGELTIDLPDEWEETFSAKVHLQDFTAETQFYNPYSADVQDWSYGFYFRKASEDEYYELYIRSFEWWTLYLRTKASEEDKEIASGSLENLNVGASDSNVIRLVCSRGRGEFYLNGQRISGLVLDGLLIPGDIQIFAEITDNTISGIQVTRFTDFAVWALPK